MKVWKSIIQAQQELDIAETSTVLTIGNFDGVHCGHQAIMERTKKLAKEFQIFSLAVTFVNHTESLLGETPLLINIPSIRRELLAKQGIDGLLEIDFDYNFSQTEPEFFFKTWLVEKLKAKVIVVGYDFRFGAGGRGDFSLLQSLGAQYGILIERINPVEINGVTVSSSKIRQYLTEGKLETANAMLGYQFVIAGEVISGEQLGRKMGYPTANLQLDPQYVLPRYGVYLVQLMVQNQHFYGIANVGLKPTFGGKPPLVEVYLFDVEINLYHQNVEVQFLHFMRPEIRFSGLEALKEQISKDVLDAKSLLSKLP